MTSPLPYGTTLRRSRRGVWNWIVVIAVALATLAVLPRACRRMMDPRIGQNVPRTSAPLSALPSAATAVSYRIGGAFDPWSAFEFDIDEAGFLTWAKGEGYDVRPIDAPVSMHRFDETKVEIADGYYYRKSTAPDAAVHVAYDKSTSRSYYYAHTR